MSTIKSSAENLTLNADGANNDVIIQSNGSTKVTVDGQNSRVGIGTTSPASPLHIKLPNSSTAPIVTFDRNDGAVRGEIKYDDTAAVRGFQIGTTTQHDLALKTGNTTRLQITYDGDVNIGETGTPYPDNGKLHVKQLVGGRYVATFRHDGNSDDSLGIAIVTGKNTGSSGVVAAQFKDGDGNDVGKIYHTGTGLYYNTGASGGIEFTNGGAANTLDDYEEGTWTPIISDGTNVATAAGTNGGRYTKIGKSVSLTAMISFTSLGSLSGAIKITGLPFTNGSDGTFRSPINIGYMTPTTLAVAGASVTGYIELNQTNAWLNVWDTTGGVTSLQASEISQYTSIFIGATYFTA